jgi:hypothetical protein
VEDGARAGAMLRTMNQPEDRKLPQIGTDRLLVRGIYGISREDFAA